MIDLGVSKLALVGAIALIVLGPEKLPKVARTVGTLLGKAQRYVADVKAEVNRSMELDELKKMKESMETAARDVEQQIQTSAADFEKDWAQATGEASSGYQPDALTTQAALADGTYPVYKRPNKRWRNKVSAMPGWYKARAGVRTKALSGAARVARYRPKRLG